jgi:hypothetical protein
MVLLYSLGFNADLLSEEYCVYGTLDNCAESLLYMPVLQQIWWCYENGWPFSLLKMLLSAVILASYKYRVCCVVLSAVFSCKALQFELLGM